MKRKRGLGCPPPPGPPAVLMARSKEKCSYFGSNQAFTQGLILGRLLPSSCPLAENGQDEEEEPRTAPPRGTHLHLPVK